MSLFNSEWRSAMQNSVAPEIDQQLGAETFTVTPTKYSTEPSGKVNVNLPRTTLPNEAFDLCGIFSWRTMKALSGNGVPVLSRDPRFRIGYHVMNGRHIGRGYRITRCTGELFEVTGVHDDGVSMIEVDVVQLGRPRQGPHPSEAGGA